MRTIRLFLFWVLAVVAFQVVKFLVFLDRKLHFKIPFPRSIEQLREREEWCIEVFRKSELLSKDSTVVSYTVNHLNPHNVFRSDTALCTIVYENNEVKSEIKFIAKFSPSMGTIRDRVVYNLQGNHVKEVQFYNEMSPLFKTKLSPDVYFAGKDNGTGNMCLLLEYLEGHKEYSEITSCPVEVVPVAVKGMAKMHAAFWNVKDKDVEGIAAIPPVVADFFQSYCRIKKWSKPALSLFRKSWEKVNVPQTVIHGDARIGNIMFPTTKGADPIFIDFQAVRMSLGVFDLAYFLNLSIPPEKRMKLESDMLLLYYEHLTINGVSNYDYEDLLTDYNYAVMMCLTMLATPWLNFEASFETSNDSAMMFVIGAVHWSDRIKHKVRGMADWVAENYELPLDDSRLVIEEILNHLQDQIDVVRNTYYPDPEIAAKKYEALMKEIKSNEYA